MTAQTKATLKSYFDTNCQPTAAQFASLIDSLSSPVADITVAANDASALVKAQADYVCDGVNDEVEIQAAIDIGLTRNIRVDLSGGTFVVSRAGTFVSDSITNPYCVYIGSTHYAVELAGHYGSTVIKLADSQLANSASLLIYGTQASKRTNPTYIHGIIWDGNGTNQSATWTDFGTVAGVFSDEITIDRCRFINWKHNGLHVFRLCQKLHFTNNYCFGPGAVRLENMWYLLSGNIFEDTIGATASATVQIPPDADLLYTCRNQIITNNFFIGGWVQLNTQGAQACVISGNNFAKVTSVTGIAIKMESVSSIPPFDSLNNVIVGNTFYDISTAIFLAGSGEIGSKYNIVSHNNILDGPDAALQYGIRENGGTTGLNRITDNYIDASAVTKIEPVAGGGSYIRGNANYVTEAEGAAATVADGGTITHGCVAAPTRVSLTGSVAGEIVTVTSISATTITVAIKKHDGTAGTSQTIYWSAKV